MLNYDLIPTGDYEAKIISYMLSESKNGHPQVMVQFKEVTTGWEKWWYGSLKAGKAFEITMENLRTLGLQRGNEDALAKGYGAHALDEESDHKVRIKHETYEGKERDVLTILSPIKAKSMAPTMQKSIMSAIKADMLANAPTAPKQKAKVDSEDLPF